MRRLVLAASLLLSALAIPASASETVAASCRTDSTMLRAVFGDPVITTTSSRFTDIDMGAPATFVTQGAVADCVIVTFSGSIKVQDGAVAGVTAIMDGRVARPPGVRCANQVHDLLEACTMAFTFDNVAKGSHTVRLKWRVSKEGYLATMRNRTALILFKGQ